MTFEKILPQLIKLTADVGKVIMSFYKADMAVEMKLNKTPLTIADQRAHQLIVEGLNRLTPNVAILSEESDTATFEQRSSGKNIGWLIHWMARKIS
ncbi:hypothetical protein BSPWISOXPB_6092 [uncultured Gammaproteobacteria bacterium]|nr:hypothetical protein BSPWISOXPB_6092 [uncultured Gammaproteobacteria bacterium]